MLTIPEFALPKQLSKKQQIYDALLGRIQDESLPVGTRLPNTAQLAEEWKVAHATAHAALNELTRNGWLVRYPKQGTFVTRPREKTETSTLAVVLPPRQDILNSGNADEVFEVLQGLSEGSIGTQWQVRIESIPSRPTPKEQESAMQSIMQSSAAAFIGESQYSALIEKLAAEKFPVVTLVGKSNHGAAVAYDRFLGVKRGVEHLLNRGFKKIAYLGTQDLKFQYFQEILSSHGVSKSEIYPHIYTSRSDAKKIINDLVRSPFPFSAVFVANYQIATALANEMRVRNWKIPDNLAVMAMGIEPNQMSDIELSYVRIPYLECGSEAMKLVSAEIGKRPFDSKLIIQPELILRQSA